MSSSPGGGETGVVVGGRPVQDQPVENGAGVGATHSESAWRNSASRRCLRMRAAAKADEGKVVVVGDEEDEEERELEDIVLASE